MVLYDEHLHCSGCDRLQPVEDVVSSPQRYSCSSVGSSRSSSRITAAPTAKLSSGSKSHIASASLLPTYLLRTVLLILLLLIDKGLSLHTDSAPSVLPQGSNDFSDGQSSKLYYRYLHMDPSRGHLYVGAMNNLYRVNLNDISEVLNSVQLEPWSNEFVVCSNLPFKSQDFDCKNHIRSVIVTDDSIQVCGTGAFAPRYDILNTNDLSVKDPNTPLSGRGMCPFDPNDNATSIYITSGNPGDLPAPYTAGNVLRVVPDPVIYRQGLVDNNNREASSLLRTYQHDSKWLNEPHFVGSFEVGPYVYFFFRESALEYTNCGKSVFSRVARVCKNDMGGPSVLEFKWTTYLKARLNCSISGDYPFYFNAMYDVKRIGNTFYAVFTTNNVDGLYGSAVCAFTENEIETAFSGTFKEQEGSNKLWLPVEESRIPQQRPGQCINDSRQLPDITVQFIQQRPLMDEAVIHNNVRAGTPLYYNNDVIYNSIAVDTLTYNRQSYDVYFLGTDYGHIHKIVQWTAEGLVKSRLITVWKPFEDTVVTIWKMEIMNDYLYIATDYEVKQIPVAQCESYTECKDCAHDPYCGWHKWNRMCILRSLEANNDVEVDNPKNVCDSNTCKKQAETIEQTVRIPGDPIYFHCDTHCPTDSVLWYRNATPILIDNTKYFLSHNNGLMIFNITASDMATYSCTDASSNVELAKHQLNMPDCGDDRLCLWQEEFRNWCSEFDSYKKQFNNWVCLKDACIGEDTCMPQGVSDICPLSP